MRTLVVALLISFAAAPLAAQTVAGRVSDSATGEAIGTAFIILLDDAGNRVAATLSRADGQFIARAPIAGTYRLRVERIGYETVTSPALQLTVEQPLAYSLAVTTEAIDLEGIVVEGEQECRIRPEEGLRTFALWDEARKALEISAWTEEHGNVPYTAEIYERARNLVNLNIIEEVTRRSRFGYGQQTFTSVSAEDLAANGYVRRTPAGGFQYFGLDAKTLLSDSFLDSHCFYVEGADDEDSGLIGLAFRPQSRFGVPDITGVLWLDRETAELRFLEFDYTDHLFQTAIYEEPFGGRVDFQRLTNGAWIVDSWWIRMPQFTRTMIVETARAPVTQGSSMLPASVRGTPAAEDRLRMLSLKQGLQILETGGDVTSIVVSDETVSEGRASVAGTIFDYLAAKPVANATVYIQGTPHVTTTDSSGRFSVRGIAAGNYEVVYFHPMMDSLRITAPASSISVTESETINLNLAVPDVARCGPTAPDANSGALVGFVREALTGEPVEGAEISLGEGTRFELRGETEPNGRYLFCDVPIGEQLQIIARHERDGSSSAIIALNTQGITQRDLALSPRATIVAGTIDERSLSADREYPPLPVTGPVTRPTVQGRLLDEASEDPISGATVTLLDLTGELIAGTLTDDAGAFVIPADHVGRYQLRAERIGYLNVTSPAFDLLADELLNVQLRASMNAIPLAPLTITVDRAPLVNSIRLESRNFYERQEIWGGEGSGFGQFVDEEEIEKQNAFYVTDVLRGLDGVHVQGGGGRQLNLVMRGGCTPTIYLDGAIIRTLDPSIPLGTSLNRMVSPQSLVGIEVYPGSTKPAEFMEMGEAGLKACGSIVLWTG